MTNDLQYFVFLVRGLPGMGRCLFPVKTKSVNIMSSGDTCQPSGVFLTTSCVIQRWHITVCKVDRHLRECLLSPTAVTPVIGQHRDGEMEEWSQTEEKGGESRCRWKKRQWQIQERGGEGGVERWKQGEKQRQGTQQVFPARPPPPLQVLRLSQGNDDTAAATRAGWLKDPVTNLLLWGRRLAWATSNFTFSSFCKINTIREIEKKNLLGNRKQSVICIHECIHV